MKERVVYKGRVYSRKTNSKYLQQRKYFRRKRYERKTGKYVWEFLHREIWKDAHGKIPKGCVIRHKNGDWNDNSIENLECVGKRDHLRSIHI